MHAQEALAALGIKVNLKSVEVQDALIRFAKSRVTTPVAVIEQGMLIKGHLSYDGMRADVLFAMDPDGMDLAVTLDFSGIMDTIYGAIQSALNA